VKLFGNWPTRVPQRYRGARKRARARNDSTRRSFGLIKGVVRQMLPSNPDSPRTPTPSLTSPLSIHIACTRGTYGA